MLEENADQSLDFSYERLEKLPFTFSPLATRHRVRGLSLARAAALRGP